MQGHSLKRVRGGAEKRYLAPGHVGQLNHNVRVTHVLLLQDDIGIQQPEPEPMPVPHTVPPFQGFQVGKKYACTAPYPSHGERIPGDDQVEFGYLVGVKPGEEVEVLATAEKGHLGNLFPEYVYCRNAGSMSGWYPTALLSDKPAIGAWALLHGLVKTPCLNGQRGLVVGMQQSRTGARWQIRLKDARLVAVTEKNVHFATSEEDLLALGNRKIIMTCHPDKCRTNEFNYLLELAIMLRNSK